MRVCVMMEVASVNYQPLLLIFFFILVCKLLRSVLTPLVSWALRHVTPIPESLGQMRSEIVQLKKEIATVSATDDFAVHSRLKRRQVSMENESSAIEGEHRSSFLRKQALVEALTKLLLEMLPIVVVIYWRSVPVAVLSEEAVWPLGGVVRFPSQIPGGIGSPIWALCSRQTLQALAKSLSKR